MTYRLGRWQDRLLLPLSLGIADGIINALILASATVVYGRGLDTGLAARVAALAPTPGRTIAFLEGGYDLHALRASAGATASVLAGVTPDVAADEAGTHGGPGREAIARTQRALTG